MLLKCIFVLFASRTQTHIHRQTRGNDAGSTRCVNVGNVGGRRDVDLIVSRLITLSAVRRRASNQKYPARRAANQGNPLASSFARARFVLVVIGGLYFTRRVKYRRTVLISRTARTSSVFCIFILIAFEITAGGNSQRSKSGRSVRPCLYER